MPLHDWTLGSALDYRRDRWRAGTRASATLSSLFRCCFRLAEANQLQRWLRPVLLRLQPRQ